MIIPIKDRHIKELSSIVDNIKLLESRRDIILDVYIAASEYDGKDFKVKKINPEGIHIELIPPKEE